MSVRRHSSNLFSRVKGSHHRKVTVVLLPRCSFWWYRRRGGSKSAWRVPFSRTVVKFIDKPHIGRAPEQRAEVRRMGWGSHSRDLWLRWEFNSHKISMCCACSSNMDDNRHPLQRVLIVYYRHCFGSCLVKGNICLHFY